MAHIEDLPQSAVDGLTPEGGQGVKDYLPSLPWRTWSPNNIIPGGVAGEGGMAALVTLKVPTGKGGGLILKPWKIA